MTRSRSFTLLAVDLGSVSSIAMSLYRRTRGAPQTQREADEEARVMPKKVCPETLVLYASSCNDWRVTHPRSRYANSEGAERERTTAVDSICQRV